MSTPPGFASGSQIVVWALINVPCQPMIGGHQIKCEKKILTVEVSIHILEDDLLDHVR